MVKIIVEGWMKNPIPFASEYVIAYQGLGYDVIPFDARSLTGITKGYAYPDLINDMATNPDFKAAIINMYDKFLTTIVEENPDLIIITDGKLFNRAILHVINKKVPVIWFAADDCYDWMGQYIASAVSIIFTSSQLDKFKEQNPNSFYANTQGVLSYHCKYPIPKRFDVTFIGTGYPERLQIIKQLELQHKIHVFTFGIGWGHQYIIRDVNMLINTINTSKICLNMCKIRQEVINLRFFETIGSGTLLLTDHCPKLLKGITMAIWNNIDDLHTSIKSLLRDNSYREELAAKGYEQIHKKFELPIVLKKLMNQTKEVLKL